jgi:hypothetical protein
MASPMSFALMALFTHFGGVDGLGDLLSSCHVVLRPLIIPHYAELTSLQIYFVFISYNKNCVGLLLI